MAPITPVVAPVCNTMEAMTDAIWLDRGLFTPVDDPVYGPVTVIQSQYKMTETPPRVKWVCRPVGYDNDHIYLRYLSLGPTRLKKLKDAGVI